MTSDTVPEDMPVPLLRSMDKHDAAKAAHEKTGGEGGGFAAGGEPRACGGEGKDGARVEQPVGEVNFRRPVRIAPIDCSHDRDRF